MKRFVRTVSMKSEKVAPLTLEYLARTNCKQLIIADNIQNMSIGLATVRGHREMKSLQNCSALASIPNRQDR